MKKIIVSLVLLALMLSSCQKNMDQIIDDGSNNKPRFSIGGSNSYDDIHTLKILLMSTQEAPQEKFELWIKSLENKVEKNILLEYIDKKEYYFDKFIEISYDALLYNDDNDTLNYLSKTGVVSNLSDYLSLYKYPDDTQRIITNNEGEIWILPTYHDYSPKCRTYDADLLEKVDSEIPTTIEEFYNLAWKIKKYGEEIYITSFAPFDVINEFVDIYLAHGCYVNSVMDDDNYSLVSYNPNKETFENLVANENHEQVVDLIYSLFKNGLIYYEPTSNYSKVRVASYFSRKDITFDKESYGFYLAGTHSENLVYCSDDIGGFAFLKNTSNKEQIVSFFEEVVFPDKSIQLHFNYGIDDIDYYLNDSDIYVNMSNNYSSERIKIQWYDGFNFTKYYNGDTILETEVNIETMFRNILINKGYNLMYRPKYYFDDLNSYSNLETREVLDLINEINTFYYMSINRVFEYDTDIKKTFNDFQTRYNGFVDIDLLNHFVKKPQ